MPQYLSELHWKLCTATHTGNGRGHFALVNVVISHGEGTYHFAFLCVQIPHASVLCGTGLATLASAKQMHT